MTKSTQSPDKGNGSTFFTELDAYFSCNHHPHKGWHELGCDHKKWERVDIEHALTSLDVSDEIVDANSDLTPKQAKQLHSYNKKKRTILEAKL